MEESIHTNIDAPPNIFEKAIIGSILQADPKTASKIAGQANAELFADRQASFAFRKLRSAALSGNPLGIQVAIPAIEQSPGMLEHFGGLEHISEYLYECLDICQPHESWPQYIKELHLGFTRRTLLAAFDSASISALSEDDAESVTAEAISKVIEAAGDLRRNNAYEDVALSSLADRYLEQYNSEEGFACPFPQRQLNTAGGFRPGQIVIIAAHSGIGKSWTLIDWAIHAWKEQGKRTRIYNMEMPFNEIIDRMIAMESEFTLDQVIQREVDPYDMEEAVANIAEYGIDIVDKRISLGRIISDMASLGDDRPDIVGIDHLDLFQWKEGNEANAIKNALAMLKDVAKQYGVTFFILSQFRRAMNENEMKNPHKGMLKGSSAIEQIGDLVVFVTQEEQRDHQGDREVFKMQAVKQRQGKPCGKFEVQFNPHTHRFR